MGSILRVTKVNLLDIQFECLFVNVEEVANLKSFLPIHSVNNKVLVLINIYSNIENTFEGVPILGVVDGSNQIHLLTLHVDNWWEFLGEWYGYPRCCIKEFVSSDAIGESMYTSPMYGTGYVPCSTCVVKEPLELVNTINARRITKYPFMLEVSDLTYKLELANYLVEKHDLLIKT